jgi:hypothetical protein
MAAPIDQRADHAQQLRRALLAIEKAMPVTGLYLMRIHRRSTAASRATRLDRSHS